MGERWRVDLVNPVKDIRLAVNIAWKDSLKLLLQWMDSKLINALIYGGLGLQGIAQTPFYQFISSPDGLSQLGIDENQPPKLLEAYKRAFKISINNNTLNLKFGDTAVLKFNTPHPASGTGQLRIKSWLEWILDEKVVSGYGYKSRESLPDNLHKHIRLNDPLGGLMLPRGAFKSSGFWRFPSQFIYYEVNWLQTNIAQIAKLIEDKLAEYLTIKLT